MSAIRLKLISGECKVVSSLSRILGQHQINTSKFCIKFNEESAKYCIAGILFYVYVLKKEGRDNYEISIGNPCLKNLMKIYTKHFSVKILYKFSLESFYDFYKIYIKLSGASKKTISLKSFLGSVGTISTIKIIND